MQECKNARMQECKNQCCLVKDYSILLFGRFPAGRAVHGSAFASVLRTQAIA